MRDELHTAQITSKVAKLIFELSVPDQMKIELLENDVQLEVRDRDDKLLYVITTFDIKEAKDGDGCSGGCNCRTQREDYRDRQIVQYVCRKYANDHRDCR